MQCINPNSPEFKAAFERTGNRLLAEIEVSAQQSGPVVKAGLKSVNALQSDRAIQLFSSLEKNRVTGDAFWNKLQQDLQIPKEQIELLKQYNTTDRNELIINMLADYSFAIEINTAKTARQLEDTPTATTAYRSFEFEGEQFTKNDELDFDGEYKEVYRRDGKKIKRAEFIEFAKKAEKVRTEVPTTYYSNLTVPGGTNYTENEIATPAITPSIKGHAQFATDQGIGWFRSDEQKESKQPRYYLQYGNQIPTDANIQYFNTKEEAQKKADEYNKDDEYGIWQIGEEKVFGASKTRRILEVQSDLFQKGRDKQLLVPVNEKVAADYMFGKQSEEMKELLNSNQFLQLLNKDNNWVTFFVKSIIQDSAKKGYEKVLFPSGNTASKVEGHTTLEEFKKQKEDRIKYLEEKKVTLKDKIQKEYDDAQKDNVSKSLYFEEYGSKTVEQIFDNENSGIENEIIILKQELERVEKEGFGALKPIYNFYENTVANVLKKQGYAPKQITDEYGNTWNEIEVVPQREQSTILFQLDPGMIEKNNKQLDGFLLNFLKPFGVKSKEFNNLKERLGIDALGATDVLNKLIWYNKDREIDTLPEEASHMIVMLMGESNPDVKYLLDNITNWSEYKSIYDTYMPIYKNEKQVKIEAVGKLVAEAIVKNFKKSGLDRSLLQKALKLINDFFNKIVSALNSSQSPMFTSARLADKIAINVLSGNTNYVASLTNSKLQLDYQKAIANNPHARNIINTFTGGLNKFKLTGSLAIAGQGEKIYRPENEPIHDLDFTVSFDDNKNDYRRSIQLMGGVPAHNGWKNTNYVTEAYYIPAKGYEVRALRRRFRDGYAGLKDLELIEKSTGKVVPINSKNLIGVDFFVYNKPNSEVSKDIFTSWQDIYGGKLGLSVLGANERMFQREKDQTDYILSQPSDLGVSRPEFVYYQTENPYKLSLQEQKDRLVSKFNLRQIKRYVGGIGAVGYTTKSDKITPKFFNRIAEWVRDNPLYQGIDMVWDKGNNLLLFREKTSRQFFQTVDTSGSKASAETLKKIKEAAKQMGINIEDLSEYAKKTGMDVNSINGVADLLLKTVAVANGKEDVALGEEIVHIATAIIEQVNPDIMTALIKEIGKYKIYKQTFEEYKDNKYYQFPDGKPNIRKIKKEAVDKLIIEKIIQQEEGGTQFPSLLEKEERNLAQKLWDTILDFIRKLQNKTNVDMFQDVGEMILGGKVGATADILTSDDIYLQIEPNDEVDRIYNSIVDVDDRTILNPATVNEKGEVVKKRHYTFDGKEVGQSVTEKAKSGKEYERTEFEKIQDEYKQEWGLAGHDFIEQTFKNDLLDSNGYAKEEFTYTPIKTDLNPTIQKGIRSYIEELVRSYPEGTRFLIERKSVNTKEKGMLASTLDFIAIEPYTKADGTKSAKVDILDWKFTAFDRTSNEDIPFFKQDEWKIQMGEYSKMAYLTHKIKSDQLRKTRMIPFIANYERQIKGDKDSKLMLTSLEIGKVDNLKETKLYLLPVALDTESTNVKKADELIASLREQWSKLYKSSVSPEEKFSKNIQLNEMSKAIRSLHMKLDFSPLLNVGITFMNKAKKVFDQFEEMDFTNLTQDDIVSKMGELLDLKSSSDKFTTLDEIFLAAYPKDELNEEQKELLSNLSKLSKSAIRLVEEINKQQMKLTAEYALKEGFTNEKTKDSILEAEKEVDFMSKTFLEGTKLAPKIARMASNVILKSSSLVSLKVNQLVKEFTPLLLELEKEAKAAGKSAFDMIGEVRGGNLKLIRKIDKTFFEDISKAKEQKNKKFFIENMDKDEYDRLAKEQIDKGIKELELIKFSSDSDKDYEIRQYRIKKLRDSLDINRDSFNGYKGYNFDYIFKRVMKEEEHYSPEYKELQKNPGALKVWEFFTKLNLVAREMGYISKQGLSFFPLVEATIIDKFSQTENALVETKDFFKDMYTVRDYEAVTMSKIDPETGKLKKSLPKYFTRTERSVTQLSKDLTKVGPLWIKSLMEYKARKEKENLLLTLHNVENAKGHIIVDESGDIIYDSNGDAKVDSSSNKNSELLEKINDDWLYGLNEDLSSIGNAALGKTISALPSDTKEKKEERVVSVKKLLQGSNSLTQALAVGLKLAVAIPNYFGVTFHAFINAGGFYRFREFQKRNAMITSGVGLSTVDKALLDTIVPINEDVSKEEQRKLAKKQGYLKYLSSWSMIDVAMVTNSWPERQLQFANALAFNDNSMVVDGKIINIRQYLRAKDRETKYPLSVEERKTLESTFEDRVKELKETKSLSNTAKIENDSLVIPGVTDEELAKYRATVIEFSRKLNGQMSRENKAGYRRDTILKSFMMFRNWIPKQVNERTMDIQKNEILDEWEYGRMRVFFKTWRHLGLRNILKIRNILAGNEEGLKIMNEILEEKKASYKQKTGKELEITQEEFYDLMRQELGMQMRELGTLFALMTLLIAAKAAIPPDDEDKATANKYKFFLKLMHKTQDELSFYYNPMTIENVTRGSILPGISVLVKTGKIIDALGNEALGQITEDEELMDKAHPTKAIFDIIPGPSQFQQEILPVIYPELAKEMGIRVTSDSRKR